MPENKSIRPEEITSVIRRELEREEEESDFADVGTVLEVGDGIARIYGLDECRSMELLQFPHDVIGIAMNLEEDNVGCVLLGDDELIEEGDEVKRTGRISSVPVGEDLLGRTVDALGRPLDGRGEVDEEGYRSMDRVAPGIVKRQPVDQPLHTGYKIVDSLTPIGRGQRELIVGDRQTGKSTLIIDTIINQHDTDVLCVYVIVGQKMATIRRTIDVLEEHGVMDKTVVVAASATAPAPEWYLAPYAGTAIAEEFMEKGHDVVVGYDDLTKHAEAYRQVSLLLRRPPGREAFPGDIFYLHSRLLERALKMSDGKKCPECERHTPLPPAQENVEDLEVSKSCQYCGADITGVEITEGGSITALPVIETREGDISTYIPTNCVSITDGQIFLETDLFHKGIRPAMNVGTSVSRVGSEAQIGAMKDVAGELKLYMAQYREMQAFAEFGSELDEATRKQLARGERLTELLKQDENEPMPEEYQVISIYMGTEGHLGDIAVDDVARFENEFHDFVRSENPELPERIAESGELTDESKEELEELIAEFKKTFVPSEQEELAEEEEEAEEEVEASA